MPKLEGERQYASSRLNMHNAGAARRCTSFLSMPPQQLAFSGSRVCSAAFQALKAASTSPTKFSGMADEWCSVMSHLPSIFL
jgi:hypothetical protein